jgi:hypothetical protein
MKGTLRRFFIFLFQDPQPQSDCCFYNHHGWCDGRIPKWKQEPADWTPCSCPCHLP